MIIERAEIGCHHRWSGDAASSSRVWASASSSRPRTACRPSRRPCPRSGSRRAPTGRFSPAVARSPARGFRFVDPIADIAVLGSPDNPHADDYTALMWTATALSFGNPARHPVNFWAPARLLSLDGRWFSCTIRHIGGPLWITHAAERVHGGMSGSPIVGEAGTTIGVVCTTTSPREGDPNARLSDNLPGWLLRDTL